MKCEHLEVSEFGTYLIDSGGTPQRVFLHKCVFCGSYLTLDGRIVLPKLLISREGSSKAKMRTMTTQLNRELYEQLENLAKFESEKDPSKIINEILGLGLRQYKDATAS